MKNQIYVSFLCLAVSVIAISAISIRAVTVEKASSSPIRSLQKSDIKKIKATPTLHRLNTLPTHKQKTALSNKKLKNNPKPLPKINMHAYYHVHETVADLVKS